MKFKKLIVKYMTPFLLVSYTFILMVVILLVTKNGYGLLALFWPFMIFAACFILFDFILKKLLKKNTRRMLMIQGVVSLMLLVASFYLQFKKSRHDPQNIQVVPVKVSE